MDVDLCTHVTYAYYLYRKSAIFRYLINNNILCVHTSGEKMTIYGKDNFYNIKSYSYLIQNNNSNLKSVSKH